jgi:type VI secretion system secreted protein VgrG
MQNLSLDISSFVNTATIMAFAFGVYFLWLGWRRVGESGDLPYFRMRQKQLLTGWRTVLGAFLLVTLGGWLAFFGERTAYQVFPVTSTPTITSTPTLSPTPSLTPTETPTPSETPTLEFTYTPSPTEIPSLPFSIQGQFTSSLVSLPDAIFSPLVFSQNLNFVTYTPINPGALFQNPVNGVYATFSYDLMVDGAQWTAVWNRDGELVHYETKPWDGDTGGYGFTEWIPDAEEWLPGSYQVVLFVGTEPKVAGDFVVEGPPVTSTPAPPPTATATFTPTITNTPTPTATHTRQPTATSP